MISEYPRIFISGPSGSGKTTLANFIAEQFEVPFTSSSAKRLWKDHNINSHRELISRSITNPEFGHSFQTALLEMRERDLTKLDTFVTDRSALDNMVYYLLQVSPFIDPISRQSEFMKKCQESLRGIDCLIYIRFTPDIVLEDDAQRIPNTLYQCSVDAIFDFCIQNLLNKPIPILVIDEWDIDKRKKQVTRFLRTRRSYNPV